MSYRKFTLRVLFSFRVLFTKLRRDRRQRGAEYSKGCGFVMVPLFLLPALHSVQRDLGEADTVV